MSANVEIVKKLYASFANSDIESARELLDENVYWLQCEGFPHGGCHRGVDSVLRHVFGALRSDWEDFSASVEELLDAHDHVVALGKYRGRCDVTGKSMEAVFAHVFDLKEGRITRFRQYADTAVMIKARQFD